MKIVNLEIGGYRSLKDISWKPGDLNILIGPNGSGKSNLLRMLELISISAQGQLGKHIQREGGMDAIVWDGSDYEIRFRLTATPHKEDKDPDKHSQAYELKLDRIGESSRYIVDYELLDEYARVDKNPPEYQQTILRRVETEAEVFYIDPDEGEDSVQAPSEIIHEDESFLSVAAAWLTPPPQIPQFRTFLADWTIYHDFHVNADAPIRRSAVARHETRVDPDGQNLISVLHTLYTSDRDFKNDINDAMSAAFGDDFEELVFPPAADQRIQMRVRWKSLKREQSAADLSDGTLRFLFLITVLAAPNPAPLIAIDEPETGLHPQMLPIIAEYAAEAAKRTQLILTTHSPEILDAFSRFEPQTTVVDWADGATTMNVVEGETLKSWLEDYSLGSLYRSGDLENSLVDSDD